MENVHLTMVFILWYLADLTWIFRVLMLLNFISIKLQAAVFPPQVLYFCDFPLHISGSHFSWKYTLLPAH